MDTNRNYRVLNADELIDLDEIIFHESVRWNNERTKFIAKFKGEPSGDYLTHEEALALMETTEWKIVIL